MNVRNNDSESWSQVWITCNKWWLDIAFCSVGDFAKISNQTTKLSSHFKSLLWMKPLTFTVAFTCGPLSAMLLINFKILQKTCKLCVFKYLQLHDRLRCKWASTALDFCFTGRWSLLESKLLPEMLLNQEEDWISVELSNFSASGHGFPQNAGHECFQFHL